MLSPTYPRSAKHLPAVYLLDSRSGPLRHVIRPGNNVDILCKLPKGVLQALELMVYWHFGLR
jgi:hypothetical protein